MHDIQDLKLKGMNYGIADLGRLTFFLSLPSQTPNFVAL